MKRVALTVVLAGFILLGARAGWAREDVVYFREPGKKKDDLLAGKIEDESPAGIKLKTSKGEVKSIPALQIRSVDYGEGVDAVSKVDYRNGDIKLERAQAETNPAKKADGLRAALSAYEELDNNGKLRGIASVRRYFQYRLAQTMALQARDDASRRDAALAALNEYKSRFSDGWEIVPALQLLASLQEDKGDTEAASKTLSDLSELPGLSAAMKLQSQLKGARLLMSAKNFSAAEEKLKQVADAIAANDPQRAYVNVYLMQSRIAQKRNLDGIDKKLQGIIRASKDANLLALAHNSLGDYYLARNERGRAFWEYCKVDMMYNQDKEEHAKALYYLSQLFDRPRNDTVRAEEFLTRLKSPQFDGTLYQRLAATEKKSKE